MIKICAFSDGHGYLPTKIESFDLMLIAGDNVNLYDQRFKIPTEDWYINVFCKWVNNLPFFDENSKVVWIAGNHEVALEKEDFEELESLISRMNLTTNNRLIYLQNEEYTFCKDDQSIVIFGTPYCKRFGGWAYNKDNEQLTKLYSKIPENCDILLSHDAPFGVSDMCYGWQRWGRPLEHIGNEPLRSAILEKNPKICIHGHLHSSNHEKEILGNTDVYCVSLTDEEYEINYSPLYLEM